MNNGIKYELTNERNRSTIQEYGASRRGTIPPLFKNKTPYRVDLLGMKPRQIREVIVFTESDVSVYESKFTIGFEVEKTEFYRGSSYGANIGELELFAGYEEDGSCGVEGVTHILPLLPSGKWRNKIFDMIYKGRKIINDRYSMGDSTCGGHITLGVNGMTSTTLNRLVRKYSGIVMSIYRKRLVNNYCKGNLTMGDLTNGYFNGTKPRESGEWLNPRAIERRLQSSPNGKYQFCYVKDNGCIEFRVVSRFTTEKEMMRRYELFYEIVNFAVTTNGEGNFNKLLKRVKPIVLSMYGGDEDKTNRVLRDSKYFQKFINTCTLNRVVKEWICPSQQQWADRIGIEI